MKAAAAASFGYYLVVFQDHGMHGTALYVAGRVINLKLNTFNLNQWASPALHLLYQRSLTRAVLTSTMQARSANVCQIPTRVFQKYT